ncbi:Methyltransferase type 11 [Cucumis melo var. makuwa]|uniref:Methyltransferase type 11 n=1 Tax=Cucumis melo var. makuwa TaxID=1194695 RepID=A0A5A7T5Z3_CUCMM|nr:Methyltransferase type 11 [Cucumis melo var. makuwa]
MERHIRRFLNKLSFASIAIATLILIFLFLQTPQTCIPQILLQNPISNSPNSSTIPLLASSSPLTRRTSVFGHPTTGRRSSPPSLISSNPFEI